MMMMTTMMMMSRLYNKSGNKDKFTIIVYLILLITSTSHVIMSIV